MKKIIFSLIFTLFAIGVNSQKISIVGQNLGKAWSTDFEMVSDDGIYYTLKNFKMPEGEFKFRQDRSSKLMWGGVDFPEGVADVKGGNIVAKEGVYNISFNRQTGLYIFSETEFPTVSIVGEKLGSPWDTDEDLITEDGINYKIDNYFFNGGEFKFRLNHNWNVTWGAWGNQKNFPAGKTVINAYNIIGKEGTYNVNFNIETGEYSFTPVTIGADEKSFRGRILYPSKTSGKIFFSSDIPSVSIYNNSGTAIKALANVKEIDLTGMAAGYYIVTGTDSNGRKFIEKVLKE